MKARELDEAEWVDVVTHIWPITETEAWKLLSAAR